jgi:AcrR family transcriptional regulator
MRPRSRRERKKQETRQRLLHGAWQLFQEKGYDQTTVEDITEAADVAKGTFFNYFDTKEALLDELALWRIELLGNHVLDGKDIPESTVGRIKRVMRAMAAEFSPGRALTHHLFLARISAPVRHESAHRLGGLVRDLVLQGQAGHEIRDDVDAGLIARLLMTCVFHIFFRRHKEGQERKPCPPAERGRVPGSSRGEGDTPYQDDALKDGVLEDSALEDKLMATVDALMNGLGGPEWRERS